MNFLRIVQVAFIGGAAFMAYSFVSSAQDGEMRRVCIPACSLGPAYVGDSKIAPDIDLPSLDGRSYSLRDFRGKTVLLVFWTSTCDACKRQMGALSQLAAQLRTDPRLVLLTVAAGEPSEDVRRTLQESTGSVDPFTVLLDPESEIVAGRYGTKKFPENWVIDPEGIIRVRFDGPRDWSSALASELLRNIDAGSACPVQVQDHAISGAGALLCRDAAM